MKWEYEITHSKNHNDFLKQMNILGDQGWELIHIEIVNAFYAGFLKRPIDKKEK